MNLQDLGWNAHIEALFHSYTACGYIPGRVVSVSRELFRLGTAAGFNRGRFM
ncbi:MAG: hypothetical protein AB1767_00955 [Bacillota bacterium]